MTATPYINNIECVLLDIEGTVTPIAFVHEVLFPYARERVKKFLALHYNSSEVSADVATLRHEHAADVQQNLEPPSLIEGTEGASIESVTTYIHWLIESDRKSTGLKSLQGKIWQEGYLDGTLKARLYTDVAPTLKQWHGANVKIAIFSSGSILAQRLLFGHTTDGDLTGLVDDYFDTTTGPKTAVESYRSIAASLGLSARRILFISDVVAELDAAREGEMQTRLCVRPGNQSQPENHRHVIVKDFAGLV